jgi:hypothetical protein
VVLLLALASTAIILVPTWSHAMIQVPFDVGEEVEVIAGSDAGKRGVVKRIRVEVETADGTSLYDHENLKPFAPPPPPPPNIPKVSGLELETLTMNVGSTTKGTANIDWSPVEVGDGFTVYLTYQGQEPIARHVTLPVPPGNEASRFVWNDVEAGKPFTIGVSVTLGEDEGALSSIGPFELKPVWEPPKGTSWLGPVGSLMAPWNVKVAGLARHPQNETLARLMWNNAPDRAGNFNVNWNQYTYPVYDARTATTTVLVNSTNGPIRGSRIPWNPAWKPSLGTDQQMVIANPDTGEMWDLWQVRNITTTSISASNGSKIPSNYHTRDVGNAPSRGVGIQYAAMLVMADELLSGSIPHAGSMPIKIPAGDMAWYPATKVEHPEFPSYSSGRIPEGARFAADITDAQIDIWLSRFPNEPKLRAALRAMAVMLRDYGWFVTDTAGAASIQIEDQNTARQKYIEIGFLDSSGRERTTSTGQRFIQDMYDGLLSSGRIYAVAETGPRILAR